MSRNCSQTVCPCCDKYQITIIDVRRDLTYEEYFTEMKMDRWLRDLKTTGGNGGYGWGRPNDTWATYKFGYVICFLCGIELLAWIGRDPTGGKWLDKEKKLEGCDSVNDLSYWTTFNDEPDSYDDEKERRKEVLAVIKRTIDG